MTCVVLAGGYGTRLGSLTQRTPKPLVKVNGVAVLDLVLQNLFDYPWAKDVRVIGAYLGEQVRVHLANRWPQCAYVDEGRALGTANAFREALRHPYGNVVLCCNADTVVVGDLDPVVMLGTTGACLVAARGARDGALTMREDRGLLITDPDGTMSYAGCFAISRRLIGEFEGRTGSLEDALLAPLFRDGLIQGHLCSDYFDMGTAIGLERLEAWLCMSGPGLP